MIYRQLRETVTPEKIHRVKFYAKYLRRTSKTKFMF
jgi:hypothetical protein